MSISLIEKNEVLLAIYQNEVPLLKNVLLHEIKITTGQDLIINLRFDLEKLPEKMPKKWLDKKVNTIQVTLELIQAKIEAINLEWAVSGVSHIEIELVKDYKQLIVRDSENAEVLTIRSTWIYLGSLNGYQNS